MANGTILTLSGIIGILLIFSVGTCTAFAEADSVADLSGIDPMEFYGSLYPPEAFGAGENADSVSTTLQPAQLTGGYSPGDVVPPLVNINELPNPVPPHAAVRPQPTDASTRDLPEQYDLRDDDRCPSAKNQGICGSCWIFASYASLESSVRPTEEPEFSENHCKNLLSDSYSEGFDIHPCAAGTTHMVTAYLTRWSGPISEEDDPYMPLMPSNVSPLNGKVQKHVQNVLWLPAREGPLDNENIKQAILDHGAVAASLFWYQSVPFLHPYYSYLKSSYYYPDQWPEGKIGHAVAIVGWDDGYSRYNFKAPNGAYPPGDGAFIVRNSWGSAVGNNGFEIVSYYDAHIGRGANAVFIAESVSNYDHNYQYDPLGLTNTLFPEELVREGTAEPGDSWFSNIFTAEGDEDLAAVGFYTLRENTTYRISAYTDVSGGPTAGSGPVAEMSGIVRYPGFHTIRLQDAVSLNTGQTFAVVVAVAESGYPTYIPVESPVKIASKATANTGESFISVDGDVWVDMTLKYPNSNVCLKAYTRERTADTG
jgi:C1A family cysteine protease